MRAEDTRIAHWRAESFRVCWSGASKNCQIVFILFSGVQTTSGWFGQMHIETIRSQRMCRFSRGCRQF